MNVHDRIGRAAVAAIITACAFSSADAVSLEECKPLADAERLPCYDRLSGRSTDPAYQPKSAIVEKVMSGVVGAGLVAQPAPIHKKPSTLTEDWLLVGKSRRDLFSIRAYKPVYVLPTFYSRNPNNNPTSPNPANNAMFAGPIDHIETKYQLSLKTKLAGTPFIPGDGFWFAYTQSSRWQVFNQKTSRPFRETDYEPELMYIAPLNNLNELKDGADARIAGLSFNHQSNGRDLPQSRSWNRIIGIFAADYDQWTVLVRPWLRLREKAEKDDNSDILDYVGRGEAVISRKFGGHQIALTLRHSLRGGARSHGSVTADWVIPTPIDHLKIHAQFFNGYGESLIDYNHRQTSIGVGLSLIEWLQ